jgi:type VI secretion system protein VasD
MNTLRACALLLAAAVSVTACATFESDAPPMATISIEGGETLNTTPEGQSTPVVVQLFALKQKSGFATADFFSLYDAPSATLGEDLVMTEQITVRPGGTATRNWTLDKDEQFIGAIAAFRDIDGAVWRDLAEVDRDREASQITVRVGDGEIDVAAP